MSINYTYRGTVHMKKLSLSIVTSCLIAPSAFALTFSQHQEACKNPKNFHNQISPTKIEITCTDHQKTWRHVGVGNHPLETNRAISIETKSDKYSSSVEVGTVPTVLYNLSCPKFEEIEENVNMTFTETCDTLLTYKEGAVKYCSDKIDEARTSNPEGIQTQSTGKVFSLCPGDALPNQDQSQQQDQCSKQDQSSKQDQCPSKQDQDVTQDQSSKPGQYQYQDSSPTQTQSSSQYQSRGYSSYIRSTSRPTTYYYYSDESQKKYY
jgi:hypothetical protein